MSPARGAGILFRPAFAGPLRPISAARAETFSNFVSRNVGVTNVSDPARRCESRCRSRLRIGRNKRAEGV